MLAPTGLSNASPNTKLQPTFTNVLQVLLPHLDNHSLLLLSLTCKSANITALSTFFRRNDIVDPARGWLVSRMSPVETLTAVRKALFIPKVNTIHYYLNPDHKVFLREIKELRYLIQDSPPLKSVRVHLEVIESWVRNLPTQPPRLPCLSTDEWRAALADLFDDILQNGCKSFHVVGGRSLSKLVRRIEDNEISPIFAYLPQDVLAHKSTLQQDGSEGVPPDLPKTLSEPLTIQDGAGPPESLQWPGDTPDRDGKGESGSEPPSSGESFQRQLQDVSPSPTSRISESSPLPVHRSPGHKVYNVLEMFSSRFRKPPRKYPDPRPVSNLPSPRGFSNPVPLSPLPLRPPTYSSPLNRPPQIQTPIGLTTLALYSDVLLQDPLYTQTRLLLQSCSSTLTNLAFQCPTATSATWKHLFQDLDLPWLIDFELTSGFYIPHDDTVLFADIHNFLIRHPTIQGLNLHGLAPFSHLPPIEQPILPNLTTLAAHPQFVSWLLQGTAVYLPGASLPRLRAIMISAEKLYRHGERPFNYALFDNAARCVSTLPNKIVLKFRVQFSGGDRWILNNLSQGRQSALCSLHQVEELFICSGFSGTFQPETMQQFPAFINLFPNIRELWMEEQAMGVDKSMIESDLSQRLASMCPGLRKLRIGSPTVDPIDLCQMRSEFLPVLSSTTDPIAA